MVAMILVMYFVTGMVITILGVLSIFDQYDRNDMITKGIMITEMLLAWPYWVIRSIIELNKNCRKEEA